MHAGIGAVDNIDVASVIDLDVVRLYRDFAALIGTVAETALVSLVGGSGNVVADFLRLQRIAHVESAHAGVEVGDEKHAPVVNGREVLIR